MKQRLMRRLVMGALALATLSGAGCAGKAVRFNNALSAYSEHLVDAGRKLGQTIRPALDGESVNAKEMQEAYDELVQTIDGIKEDFETLEVPKSNSAKRFAEGYRKFLQRQSNMIKGDMNRVVRTLKQSGSSRMARLMIIDTFVRLQQQERADLRTLRDLQIDFAREHKLPMLPVP